MGVLAFLGGLLAAVIAAKDILGTFWWTPLVGVALATLPCLRSTFDRDSDLGPGSLDFYARSGGHTSKLTREQLLAELDSAFGINAKRVHAKRSRLRSAVAIISVGLVIPPLMIGLDRPTTIGRTNGTQGHSTATTSTRTGTGAGTVRDPPRFT